MSDTDDAMALLALWKADPCRMVWDLWQATPDKWQANALRAFADPNGLPRIGLQACAGPGKTTCLAWMGYNFMLCYREPNGYAVSITGDNLKDNLWKEFARWRERSPVLLKAFELTAESLHSRERPTTEWIHARSFAKSADQDAQGRTLSGLHARSILVLADETGDMPPAVLRTAEQALTTCEWGRIVQAGNPTSHAGALYLAATTQAHLWEVIRITGDPTDPKRSPRVSMEWATEQVALYGRENPWVMAFILGEFPPSSINALLGPDDMRNAIGRHLRDEQFNFSQKRLGVDVARFGDDATVIFPRQGKAAFNQVRMRGARTNVIAARVVNGKQKWGSELELIDSTGGWAGGVVDQARLAGVEIMEINASGSPDDARYFNKRSEMNFRAAEWVKNGGALPNDQNLVRQACAVTYYFDKGKLRVTEKAQIKTHLGGASPDDWDAFCLTFALVDMPAGGMAVVGAAGQPGFSHMALTSFDPYA